MPDYRRGGGAGGGGTDIHHEGCGGGTVAAGIPIWNYEDHRIFNAIWYWTIYNYGAAEYIQGLMASIWGGAQGVPCISPVTGGTFPNGGCGDLQARGLSGNPMHRTPAPGALSPALHMMVRGFGVTMSAGANTRDLRALICGFIDDPVNAGAIFGDGYVFKADPDTQKIYAVSKNSATFTEKKVDTGYVTGDLLDVMNKFNVCVTYGPGPAFLRTANYYINDNLVATILEAVDNLAFPNQNSALYPLAYNIFNLSQTAKTFYPAVVFPCVAAFGQVWIP